MIKFFRRIRQQLLTENKFNKYLLYAIGEIVLVVIGILIALNLNNWNEQKKSEKKTELLFEDIMEELVLDINATTDLMHYYKYTDSTIYLVLNDRISLEDYVKNEIPELWDLTVWYTTIELTNDAYNNLIQDRDAIPPKYNIVLKDLNHLYNKLKINLDQINKAIIELVEENLRIQMRNHSWFADRSEAGEKSKIEYMLNDFRYKNEVRGYQSKGINNQLRYSIIYREKAVECYQKIAKLLKRPLDHESFTFNEDIAKMLVGEWHAPGHPEIIITFFLRDKRLYRKNRRNQISEIFNLSNNKIVTSNRRYATIVKENGETILKHNLDFWIKKK